MRDLILDLCAVEALSLRDLATLLISSASNIFGPWSPLVVWLQNFQTGHVTRASVIAGLSLQQVGERPFRERAALRGQG